MKLIKQLRRPIVMYNITERCQLSCRHCYNNSGVGFTPNASRLMKTVQNLSTFAGAINFTGGEPFLVPSLPDLLETSSNAGVDNIITTNGIRLIQPDGRHLLNEIQRHLYMLKVGMMGASAETNDFIRGSGNFDVCTKSLSAMADHQLFPCVLSSPCKGCRCFQLPARLPFPSGA